MARGEERIRIPRLRAVVAALATLVAIGVVVFLRRYRGADRTAMALSLLVGGGLCLVVALTWFQRQCGGGVMTRRDLWGIGLRYGGLAGVGTTGVGIGLLAVRWAIDQQAGPAAEPFIPAFFRALAALGFEMAVGFPAYLAVGAVVGGLAGLVIAEAIGISAARVQTTASVSVRDGETIRSPRRTT